MPLALDTCQSTHLSSPLTNENAIFMLCHIQNLPLPQYANLTRGLLSHAANLEEVQRLWQFKWHQVALNPQCLLRKLFQKDVEIPIPRRSSKTQFTRFLNLAIQNLMMQLPETEKMSLNISLVPEDLLQRVTSHPAYNQLSFLDDLRAVFEQGVCLTAKASRHSRDHDLSTWKNWKEGPFFVEGTENYYCDLLGRTRMWVDSEFMIIRLMSGQVWLGSRKHFLMFSDIISQRFLLILSSVLAEILGKTNYPSVEILNQVFDWGDHILEKYQNEGYRFLKLWESLCTGVILSSQVDPAIDSLQFLKNMQEEFLSTKVGTESERKSLLAQLLKLILPLRKNKHHLTQIYGLFRIWGHPTVNLKQGLKKLRSVATVHREANPSMVRLVKLKWREMFFMSYHRKHSIWPKFEFLPFSRNPSSYLHQCLENNLPVNLSVKQYDLGDWNALRLLQNFQVADKFSLSEMIADKATSLGYEELLDAIENTHSIGSAAERSVIIRWLKENLNDPLEFLTEIDSHGFSPDSGPVGVCAKEQELSIEPRFFGLLTISKRLYVVLTEAMLAESILPYFPEITMTYDSTTLLTKIYHQTKDLKNNEKESSNFHTVVVNIDFMKWNSYMRESETKDLFQDFDHLFGFNNLYQRTHEMFSKQIYLAMGVYLPEIDRSNQRLKDSEIVWSDHLGGIEGLRQKGWTIFTVVILKMVSELTGVECNMMGQGDNQVLLCKYQHKDSMSLFEQHKRFLDTLDKILEQIGPPLKPLETWSSSFYFAYGKYPVWEGSPLSMSQKKVSKCIRLTNDGLQNLHSTLSSIAANAAAASYNDTDPIIPYLIGIMESAAAIQLGLSNPFYLNKSLTESTLSGRPFLSIPREGRSVRKYLSLHSRLTNMLSKQDNDLLVVLLNYPSILGGYPILMWNELIVHGFPDPLTLAINSVVNCFKNTKREHLKDFFLKIMNPELSDDVNPEMICTDPFSINLLQGSTASDKVKRMVFDFIASQADQGKYANRVFLEFMQLAKTEQKDLCQILYSADPFNPILASSMVESTPVGTANKMMSRINKTNVLIKMMLSEKNRSTLAATLSGEGLDQFDEIFGVRRQATFFTLFGKFEQNYFHGIIYNLSFSQTAREEKLPMCSFKRAELLRSNGWKKPIEGVTTAFPLEMFFPVFESQAIDDYSLESLGFFQTQIIGKSSLLLIDQNGLGPFKPYFGSATKNKVTYEAKKLVPVAPPLLKNLLELLCVPGWMTPIGSKLDELIRKIFSSVTDMDADALVPSEDEIAGSFNHRLGAEKSKMKASLSILWGWASYILSTSDHYCPDMKDSSWETDNLAINYQSIYLTLVFFLSMYLTKQGLPEETLTIRWYTKCLDCINPVNETQINLPDETDLSQITSLDQHKDNPYCWVPGDRLLKSTTEQFSLGKRITISSLDQTLMKKLLNASVSQFIISSNYVVSLMNLHLNPVDYMLKTVPLIICLKSSIVGVLETLADDLVLKYMFYSTRNQWFKAQNYSRWLLSVLESVSNIPFSWFYSLKNFYASESSVIEFQLRFPSVRLPEGSPPQKDQIGICFHKAVLVLIQDVNFFKGLKDRLGTRLALPYSVTDLCFLHPVFVTSVITILEKEQIPSSVLFLGPFFDFFRTKVTILPSTLKAPSWKDLSFDSKTDGSSYYSTVLSIQRKRLLFLNYNMNALAERIKRPKKDSEHNFTIPVSTSCLSPLSHLDLLHQEGEIMITLLGTTETLPRDRQNVSHVLSQFLPGDKIYPDAHYFKIVPTSTSALYKLIALLKEELTLLEAFSQSRITICCTADGSGGFSAVLSKIFPNSLIIYNTLRKFSDQNPDGTGFIYPSSLSQFLIPREKVLGLRLLECDNSDLERPKTWEGLAQLSKTVDLMTCDAEGSGWNSPLKAIRIAKGFALMCHYKKTSLAILKGYVSELLASYHICNILLCSFTQVKVFRSSFSSRGNTEVYYIATGNRSNLLNFPSFNWSDTSGEIKGLTTTLEFGKFEEAFLTNKRKFFQGPTDYQFMYSSYIIRLNPNLEIKPDYWHLIRKTQFTQGKGKYNFPGPWIKAAREKYPLIRFTGYNPKNHRQSTLTKKVQIELLMELLILSALCYVSDDRKLSMERFYEEKEQWWFFCAHSFDGHYTMGLKKETNLPKFSLEISSKVSELLTMKHFQKIFSEIGKFNCHKRDLQLVSRFSPLTESWATQDVLRCMFEERTVPINYPLWAAPIKSFWELPSPVLDSLHFLNEVLLWDEYRILPLTDVFYKVYKLRGATVENAQKRKNYYREILSQFLNSQPKH